MALLTPTQTKGENFVSGVTTFLQSDNASDPATANPIEYSAAESDALKSLLKMLLNVATNSGTRYVENTTGSDIPAATLCYISGYDATNSAFLVSPATPSHPPTLVTLADLPNTDFGVAYQANVSQANLNTSAASAVGALVYLDPATPGAWTFTAGAFVVGIVVVKDSSVGQISWNVNPNPSISLPISLANGGTGQATAQLALNALAAAVTNHYVLAGDGANVTLRALGASDLPSLSTLGAAAKGANSDITSLSGLTTALSIGQGGTGQTSAANALSALGGAAKGANSDITSLSGLSTALSIGQGGTGQTTAAAAANALLPSQSGKAGDCLTTDGTNLSWAGAAGGADVPIRAYKSTDDSKSTVAADSDLSLALVAGNKYAIDGVLFFVGGSGYLEMQWALSGIASYFMWDFNNNGGNNGSGENAGFASGAPVSSPQPALASGFYSGNGWNMPVRVAGYIEVSSDGNLQICWGASSSTIALKKGSWLRAVKIG